MDCIFKDSDETLRMVQGAYKKLKSYFYFDKTQLFVKKRIATLESDRNLFATTLATIAENLSAENTQYFETLINEIDFCILPKKFKSADSVTDCVQSTVDHEQKIEKVNFFIDMPIELYIIDFLWTLYIGKISDMRKDLFRYAAGTRFKKSLFNDNPTLNTGIDFDSNRTFAPYFSLYSKWRNDAFKTIQKQHDASDTILICLDLKSFYYSVEFNFSQVDQLLMYDERLGSISFLTSVIEKIYSFYTKLVGKQKKGIKNKKESNVFPIGCTSSIILRELYLFKFDANIMKILSPLYYSRYVDDMLIVLREEDVTALSKENIIDKYLLDTSLVVPSNESDLKFTEYSNIRIQKDKVNCFTFQAKQRAILLDIYAEIINMNSSEANLLPDVDVLNSSFIRSAYNIKNIEISNKIRDLGFLQSNNYNATKFINGLQRIVKNTNMEKSKVEGYFDEILEFYSGSQSLEFSNNWRAIFELFLLANDKIRARLLFRNIKAEIEKLTFESLNEEEVYEKQKRTLIKRLKENLNDKLYIAAALATSLDANFSNKSKVRTLARAFRTSNMLNHTLVSYPLINYSKLESFPLINPALSFTSSQGENIFLLDEFKLRWTPRYINALEFFIANFLYGFSNKKHLIRDPNEIFNKFVQHNNLGQYLENPFKFSSTSKAEKENHMAENFLFSIRDNARTDPKIALVNTKIKENDVLSSLVHPMSQLTIENKTRLYRILNTAKEESADILIFPEFYFPIAWLMDVATFSVKNKISIVTGLQYLTSDCQAYNNVCTVIPTVTGSHFSTGFLQFREKNFYAPKEKIELSKCGFICKDNDTPVYYIIDNGKYRFSTILCYEFTDIASRANLKAKIEVLLVPQLNKDTNYFSAIVESTTRDLHCFVVQANTSSYGDSRITAPYKTEYKNILQVKGGDNDIVMIAQLNIEDLKKVQMSYPANLERAIQACSKC